MLTKNNGVSLCYKNRYRKDCCLEVDRYDNCVFDSNTLNTLVAYFIKYSSRKHPFANLLRINICLLFLFLSVSLYVSNVYAHKFRKNLFLCTVMCLPLAHPHNTHTHTSTHSDTSPGLQFTTRA